ncbi:MAG TPA: hypothetical protein DCP90_08995 [Clostridiales bacterium]|nr:MAG: hypothetical protein A2Y22_02765 [Clostridiales bacterium GWD2_32_59]HAN10730.1 hypothetical protein [Clostridiales bacterium]
MELKDYKKHVLEKLDKVKSIYRNSKRQREALLSGDTEKFLRLIDKREDDIKRINELESLLINCTENYTDKEVDSIKKEIMDKYKKIQEMDRDNQQMANDLKKELYTKVKSINIGKKVINQGYNKQDIYEGGIYIDKTIGKKK